jgi:hypothetical protein
MRVLSAPALLEAWERGLSQGLVERALTLLAAANPETSVDDLAKLSIGQRDCDLVALRAQTFGSEAAGVITCPGCGERLEMSLGAANLAASPGSATAAPICIDGYEIEFRLPNSSDLIRISAEPDTTLRERLLLKSCVTAVHRDGERVCVDQLPSAAFDVVEAHMARVDPQADARLEICCPSCDHRWESVFDIVSFFWSEIEAWANRILHEVHVLASAYGWSEREILALSAQRRQFYLEKVGG